MSTAGKAVFLSALTVVMALAAVFLVPVMVFRSMALGMILSVVAVAAAWLTLLPALLVALVTGAAVGVSGPIFGFALGEQWVVPSWSSVGLIFAAAFFLIGGYLTAVDFMRHGDISVVAPFRYTVIVFAMIVGFIVWGEVPDLLMVIGTGVIIATGVYTFHRERNTARLRDEAAAGEGI